MNSRVPVLATRWIAAFLAAADIFGTVMFWSSSGASRLAVPAALLLLSLSRPSLFASVVSFGLVVFGYTIGGIPFFDPLLEADVRAMHLAELVLVAFFVYLALRESVHRIFSNIGTGSN